MPVRRQKILNGVQIPEDAKGKRSSSSFGKSLVAASLEPLNADAAQKVLREKNWRWGYQKHLIKLVQESCKSGDNALKAAAAGLKYAHENAEFVREEKAMSLADGMNCTKDGYYTAKVTGTGDKSFSMPYDGEVLQGESLISQIKTWVKKGVIEADAGQAVENFVKSTNQDTLLGGHYFCMLGAGSAMGPFELLMRLGATVVAVDLDRPHIWERLIRVARQHAGTLIFPVNKPMSDIPTDYALFRAAGTDLIGKTPEIANWLASDDFQDRKLVIGAYAYLNGELFVRVSIAMDAIIAGVIERKKRENKTLPAIAYLCTPTNCHVVSKEAYAQSMEAYKTAPLWSSIFSMFGKMVPANKCKPVTSEDGHNICYLNELVGQQGPNYALAKRIQIWRSLLARAEGCVVSSNVAPSTATVSVTQNRMMALAYNGFHFFQPLEVFQQETTNALMTAVMLNDLTDEKSNANPNKKLEHPMMLQAGNSCHGGMHRIGFQMGTIGEAAAICYVVTHPVSLLVYAVSMALFFTFFVL